MKFKNAINNTTYTENGAATLASSGQDCVDLFFKIGAMRGQSVPRLHTMFEKALRENEDVAIRILLWARDVREGAGERKVFRDVVNYLETEKPQILEKIIHMIPVLGRWDDVLYFKTPHFDSIGTRMIAEAILSGNQLAAKWAPREKSAKRAIAMKIIQAMGVSPKTYRKMLAMNTNVVESQMCRKEFDSIKFEQVPSLAHSRYMKAFYRNAEAAYREYQESLENGETKINASAIYPYDVLKNIMTSPDMAEQMWKALPNYLSDSKILPMVDTSSSMDCRVAGNKNLTAMDIAISLGLYVATKQTGDFSNMVLNFNSDSHITDLSNSKTLKQKYERVRSLSWGGSTNLQSAFESVLETGLRNGVKDEDMPKIVLVLSDMEFNSYGNQTNLEGVVEKYRKSGYTLPTLVWWNLASRNDQSPATCDQKGNILVSGFSPSVMKSVLQNKEIPTPETVMLETIMRDRYNWN